MANIAVIENDKIVNVFEFESLEIAQSVLSDKELLDISDSNYLGIDSFKQDGKWYPRKHIEDGVWYEEAKSWMIQSEIDWIEINKTRPHCYENKPCIHYSYNFETGEWYFKSPLIAHPDWAEKYPEHLAWLRERTEVIISEEI